MPHDVTMPQLGMAQDAGKIVSWLKAPGDPVAEGDALFEVETDKATMEVEAQAAGFLSGVTAAAGEDVPVGQVIARITEEAEDDSAPPEPSAPSAPSAPQSSGGDDLPEGIEVTMPQLGMAQDSGLLVAWHKSPGDAVQADDVLFEVETDKSTMEVPAGADGYLAATLAEAGEDVPVGNAVAVISAEAPSNPVTRSAAAAKAPAPKAEPEQAAKPTEPETRQKPASKPAPKTAPAVSANGRILASPKARKMALDQGLDLNRLVEAGHPQPYHVADLEVLKSLPTKSAQTNAVQTRHLTAEIPADGFADFARWAADTAGLSDQNALLAGLAAACLPTGTGTVRVEALGQSHSYAVMPGPLSTIQPAEPDRPADLILRDLRFSRITSVHLGAEPAPVLTLARNGDALAITLECAGDHLTASDALTLLSEFAGRMEQPLRHLL